ncbi:MAG: hypothetical protein Q4G69_11085 [Planctomycetia bacterium]|nr:hypothetical protein [Planctomycetia bacterium]
MAEQQTKESGELSQRSRIARQAMESRSRAEKAAGVGSVENEAQKSSSDRQSDGRNFSKKLSGPISSSAPVPASIDFSGKLGKNLDLFG